MADHHDEEHGQAHVGPDVHLPDPSVWPLMVGVAFFLVAAAIVWWARDPDNAFAGPFVGAAVAAALISAAGWAYEDGRMKKKAEEHADDAPRNARYTQVITFAVAEGQFETATAEGGVVRTIESADSNLHNLAGFQDLRIIASPSAGGPSQVLVETTWADREGLATYDETRQSVLDMVNEFPEQVVPGSVQVFDMVVVRDTKDVALRFGMGTAATLVGGLALGGFLLGAGLTMFEGEGQVASDGDGNGGGGGGFADTGTIVARNIAFIPTEFTLPPGAEVTLTFDNQDASPPHNFELFDGEDENAPHLGGCTAGCDGEGDEVITPIGGLGQYEFTFTTPEPGRYFYWCVIHPTEMRGFMVIEEGAPVPGGGGGAGDSENGEGDDNGDDGAETDTIVALNTTFSPTEFTVPANTEITLTLDNQDESPPHNFELFAGENENAPHLGECTVGCDGEGDEVITPIGGQGQYEFTFTTPDPGRYFYWCVLHPNDMRGFMTVE